MCRPRLGRSAARLATILLLALAPMACEKKTDPADEPTAEELAAAQNPESSPDGTEEVPEELKERDVKVMSKDLDGSWRSKGPGECTQVDFDLTRPAAGDSGTGVFYRTPGEPLPLQDLYMPAGSYWLAGMAPSGGPFECTFPRRMRFFVESILSELPLEPGTYPIKILWRCVAEDGLVLGEQLVEYESGACPGGTALVPKTPTAEPPPGDGSLPVPNDDTPPPPTGDVAVAPNDGTATAPTAPASPGACTLAGAWRQSTVNVGATTWEITASGQATETGIGYAKGTATLTGKKLRIDWTTTNGYAGVYSWTLDSDCRSGTGSLEFTAGRTGTFDSIVTR